ncbi:hypothetical protein [Deinococcus soli (ex Cha et al. 2016)]|uniref:hypothetical protein n=1 Tax=Deinococcus soli (ex Cha et al. 2016) TaxID=1309411 RepID=UPI00166D2813|nr:hypothetical protein [Deinococcus soli (ex Cha et al. 2016)]GGB83329.1 hypothetical protein GCM10008019_44310 [Deinococcus soli (ex Cha et al. 2016)]
MHARPRWTPTPVPHLPMRLHANLWAPRSVELAGALAAGTLPVSSVFRRITVSPLDSAGETEDWARRRGPDLAAGPA